MGWFIVFGIGFGALIAALGGALGAALGARYDVDDYFGGESYIIGQ